MRPDRTLIVAQGGDGCAAYGNWFDPDFFRTEEQRRLYRTDEQIQRDVANNPLHQMPFLHRRSTLMPEETGHQFDERNQPVGISGDTNPFVDGE